MERTGARAPRRAAPCASLQPVCSHPPRAHMRAAPSAHLGGRMALRMSSVCSALPLLSTPNVSFLPLAFSLSRLLLTSTGLSYLTRLSTGGIIPPRPALPTARRTPGQCRRTRDQRMVATFLCATNLRCSGWPYNTSIKGRACRTSKGESQLISIKQWRRSRALLPWA